ncbi:hypothetical protein [Cryobacterium sp. Hz9]|nr:hypothetical protein [Cryobacterium sp. Hz9]
MQLVAIICLASVLPFIGPKKTGRDHAIGSDESRRQDARLAAEI